MTNCWKFVKFVNIFPRQKFALYGKYTLPDVQNECLELMALHILCDVSKNIAAASCYSVIADECTDCSNKEQFTVNIQWVDEQLKEHESFIGLYKVDTIDADSTVFAIRDVLL